MALEILQRAVEESERAVIRVMEETVPQEILERGLLALEAYNKARSEGTTVVKRVPIMLIGQYCSGKTSLKKSLKGQCFHQNEEGTSGIDADPSFFKVSHELWKVGEKDQDASPNSALLLNRHLAKCTVEHLSLKKILEVGSAGAVAPEDSDSKDVSQYLAPESSFMGVTERETLCCEELPMMPEIPDGTSDSLAHIKTGPEIENDRESKERLGNVAEILLQKIIPNEEDVYSMMWDFAGESVYYTIHPIFLTPKAIYLLVHDLSQDAHAPAKPVRCPGRYKNYTDSHCLKQNVDYLYFWMSLVASLANHCDSDPSNTTSKTLPESLPPVFLVCTHADEPFDHTDAKTLARSVYGSLMDKPSRTHLCKDFFFVDNTKSGKELECSEVVRLRKVVLAACNELQKKREAIPIKWLEFENAIQEKKENGFKYILLEEAIGMAEECDISGDKQFQTLMNFLHDQRVLIHFTETPELDKLVVLDCQWLIDVFMRAITVTPYEGEDNEFAGLWKTFEEEGILKEDLLKHVWSPFLKDKITYGSLVAIMEKFSLLCSLPLSNPSDAKEYLVPSMLMSLSLDDVKNLVDSSRIPSLFIKFKSGQVPPGLFHRLMLQFLQRSQGKQSSELRPCLSQYFSRFYPDEKKNFSVILLRHSSSIEVVFHSGEQPDVKCVQKVRRKLELVLESMRNEFRWLKGMRYEVAFICPVCCQRGAVVSQCRTHKIQSCKQEECLHFWFESEINEESNCRKNATAKDSRVRIEKFAPWTAPREIQVTNDRHAETHAACEKEIPAVEYFLSECACDATPDDFFLKLTTILELDQASLKDPNSATRTVIRTLARRAKDLERVDVFKHLRNVVPAGVIGPTLAEHIDVSDIPLDQRRRLTMNLSSGEEWKMVAEELGLKPFEIQFLDKRHKDPFEAVLSFVSQQGPLSVGSLYDLLNKLGYPLMADVL
ncbi:uncharacterized protein LOC111341884 [Stylophora pistillata]|nr:uncharacterized protein LOC111341884 [Stylophora pistillata]